MKDVDWEAMKEEWLNEVTTNLIPLLLGDARFQNGSTLTDKFVSEITVWRRTGRIRPLIEIGNELATAKALLDRDQSDCRLQYEPAMAGTAKRIDFLWLSGSGRRDWVEVKTVAPTWIDDEASWERFMRIAEDSPGNAKLVVDREWGGAALSGQSIKARWSFIKRTAEIEGRSKEIPVAEKGAVWLLFCSTGFAWHVDELEDFADFYRFGNARADDWLRSAMERYMREDNIVFDRSLAGFHYLARKHDEVIANKFVWDVTGPRFGRS